MATVVGERLGHDDYGSIKELRELLGLPPPHTSHDVHATCPLPEDALLVSFDTEWERQGLKDHVVEVGVTTLDTRDIIDTAPGEFAYEWIAKAKTHHYVVNVTRRARSRMDACLFSDDTYAGAATVKRDLINILQTSANPPHDPSKAIGHGQRKVILVGHSVHGDLRKLVTSPGLELDFRTKEMFLTRPTMAFDTARLTVNATQQGARIRSAKLGELVNRIGVHPQYEDRDTVFGVHNAGNDTAYTMMALLLYAVRWEQLVPGEIKPLSAEKLRHRDELLSKLRSSVLTESVSRDDALEKRAFRGNKLVAPSKRVTPKPRAMRKLLAASKQKGRVQETPLRRSWLQRLFG